jgi:hypothetical protein
MFATDPRRRPPPPDARAAPKFVLFVRGVQGHMVPRYQQGRGPYQQLGWSRHPTTRAMHQDTDTIHPITDAEMALWGSYYKAHIHRGELVSVPEGDYLAQVKKQAAADPAAKGES